MSCPTISTINQSLTFTVETLLGDGTLYDATGDVTYSIANDTTDAVILTGTMDKVSGTTGNYTETVICSTANGFELNTSYTITVSATVSGVAVTKTYTFICVSAEFGENNDYYCELSDIEDVFGESNVNKWADMDNDGDSTKITARINRAIIWATAEIDSILKNSVYAIPLLDAENETPVEIVDIASNLAGVWLYENRGVQDFNPETGQKFHRLEYNRKRAYQSLAQIQRGVKNISAVKSTASINTAIPKAVKDRRRIYPHGYRYLTRRERGAFYI